MELLILQVQTSGIVALAFMLRQAGGQAVTVELTLLEVRSSWHCGSCFYAKAGKQAVTVELTLPQIQTSQHCSAHIYVTPTELIYTKDSHYYMQPKLMQQKN